MAGEPVKSVIRQVGKERIWVGFPASKVKIEGIAFLQDPLTVSDGFQQVDDIMGEDACLAVKLFSDDRGVFNFSGLLTKEGATNVPKKGDVVTVDGWNYAVIQDISIAYSSKHAPVTGTVEAWDRTTPLPID